MSEDKKDEFERMRDDKLEREVKSKIAILKSLIRDGTENQPKRKKKKKENLMTVCDEIISFNDAKWKLKRRKELEEREKVERNEQERTLRLDKAKRKKETLLEKIKQSRGIDINLIGKDKEWIERRKKGWRKFRDKVEMEEEDESLFWNEIIECIQERISRESYRENMENRDISEIESQSNLIKPPKLKVKQRPKLPQTNTVNESQNDFTIRIKW